MVQVCWQHCCCRFPAVLPSSLVHTTPWHTGRQWLAACTSPVESARAATLYMAIVRAHPVVLVCHSTREMMTNHGCLGRCWNHMMALPPDPAK